MTLETRTIQPFPAQRTALVTGAGAPRGIGRRVVRKLVAEGWNVAAADIDGAAVEEFAAELNAEIPAESGLKVIGVGVDISDQASVDAAFARVDVELPQLVALVNLAGIPSPHSILEITSDIWDRVMNVNGKGTLLETTLQLGNSASDLDANLAFTINFTSRLLVVISIS